jgi:hypothetical protein
MALNSQDDANHNHLIDYRDRNYAATATAMLTNTNTITIEEKGDT